MQTLNPQQAYAAMYAFLKKQHSLSKSEELAMLLGSMSLLPDGSPADPAMLEDWSEAIEAAIDGRFIRSLRFPNK